MNLEDTEQDQEILRMRDSLGGKVPWVVFVWALGLFVVAMGLIGNMATKADSKADGALTGVTELRGEIKVIQNDVGWIRKYIEDQGKKSATVAPTTIFQSKN